MKYSKQIKHLLSAGKQYEPNEYKQKHIIMVNYVCFLSFGFMMSCAILSYWAYQNTLLTTVTVGFGILFLPTFFLVRSGYLLLGKVYFSVWSNICIVLMAAIWGNPFHLEQYLIAVSTASIIYFNYDEMQWSISTAVWGFAGYCIINHTDWLEAFALIHISDTNEYVCLYLDFGKFFLGFIIVYKLATLNYISEIKSLNSENKKLRGLAIVTQKTHNMILIGDENGNIEWANEGFFRTTGYTMHEIKGRNPSDILHGKNTNPDTVNALFQALQNGESHTCELINYNKKGEEYWVEISVTPIRNKKGLIEQFVSIELDITQRKKEQLRLEAQNKSLREISFIQSHEVRGPLASIMGLIDLLSQETTKDRQIIMNYLQISCQELDTVIARVTHESIER